MIDVVPLVIRIGSSGLVVVISLQVTKVVVVTFCTVVVSVVVVIVVAVLLVVVTSVSVTVVWFPFLTILEFELVVDDDVTVGPVVEVTLVTTGVPVTGPTVVIPVVAGGVDEITVVLELTVFLVDGIVLTDTFGPTTVVETVPVVVLLETF